MEVFQDVVLEFAEGAVEKLGWDGFGAKEHAVNVRLGETGGLEVGLQEVINHVEVGAVVGLGEVHHVFDFEGTMHVVDFIKAEGFDGVIYIRVGNGSRSRTTCHVSAGLSETAGKNLNLGSSSCWA